MDKPNFNQNKFNQILIDFIIKAKQNTYASGGEGGEKVLADGCRELVFKEKKYEYRDKYFGFNPFAGQEVVFQNKQAIWAMNYYGYIVAELISAQDIYQFLKKALKKVTVNKPFRGPSDFTEGDFRYINESEGIIENFKGEEKIFYKEGLVYKLYYHGGLIADH